MEHPAYSNAWAAHDLPAPPTGGGWTRDTSGGWSCYVEQARYGHPAKKATWLYYVGNAPPPSLRWGHVADRDVTALVSWCANHTKAGGETRRRVGKGPAAATPPAFRDVLLDLARQSRSASAA